MLGIAQRRRQTSGFAAIGVVSSVVQRDAVLFDAASAATASPAAAAIRGRRFVIKSPVLLFDGRRIVAVAGDEAVGVVVHGRRCQRRVHDDHMADRDIIIIIGGGGGGGELLDGGETEAGIAGCIEAERGRRFGRRLVVGVDSAQIGSRCTSDAFRAPEVRAKFWGGKGLELGMLYLFLLN